MKYQQRLHQFTSKKTWEITPNALSWSDDKGLKGRIPFAHIRRVRLRFQPTRVERRRFALVIEVPGETHQITNINYRGVMDFEDQSDEFTPFVDLFHQKLVAANPDVAFRSGSTPAAYVLNALLSAFIVAVILGVALFAVMSGIIWLIAIKVVIIIFYVPTLIKLLITNRPMRYDPLNIPPHIVPDSTVTSAETTK